MRSCLLLLIVLVALMACADAVDHSKFKTCSQARFCERNRKDGTPAADLTRFSVDAASVKLLDGHAGFAAKLQDNQEPKPLDIEVHVLKNGIVRMRVNENEPLHQRFEVRDAAVPVPAAARQVVHDQAAHKVIITLDDAVVFEVTTAPLPFSVALLRNGNTLVTANTLGYMAFEQYKAKKEGDEWEESFGSHKDSKPRGPAAVALDVTFVSSSSQSRVYGIPEHATSLALKDTHKEYQEPYRLYNLDVFEFDLDVPMALYGAIPFTMSVAPTATAGVFWLNAAETFVDVSTGRAAQQTDIHWISESGVIDVYFFAGPSPRSVLSAYTSLTGMPALPQRFAIAYHQCRWNYNSEEDVAAVDAGFDQHDIPYDVLWLDIEHTDGKKYFTWDSVNFPTPAKMQDQIATRGRKMVTIVDPHIKRDGGYLVHTQAEAQGLYVKKPDASGDYEGWCWPGSVSYLDFLQPKVRSYWADQFALDKYQGSTRNLYTWNDMNEPSVFNGPEVTMHKDALHDTNVEHRDVHNQYGYYNHRSTYEGQLKRDGERPFVLTRSFFAGSQRYAAMWTGDNKAEWSHLESAQPMLMSLGLAGFSFVGADVGGFFGDPDVELLTRWYQAGAYQPFFRAHAHIDAKRREPWLFGEPHTARIRTAIRERYANLPYLYTLFWEASQTGAPVMRPLFFEFWTQEALYGVEDQFMLGDAFMIKPVVQAGVTTVSVLLPADAMWYDRTTKQAYKGTGQTIDLATSPDIGIPVFQRGGTVLVRQERARRSSALMAHDPYTLVIALREDLTADGQLYVDDGKTIAPTVFLKLKFSFVNGKLTSTPSNDSTFKTGCTVERVRFLFPNNQMRITKATIGGSNQAEIVEEGTTIRKPDCLLDEPWSIDVQMK